MINNIKFLSELYHPNIIRLIEAFKHKNILYFVYELCVGGTLEDYYKNKKEKEEFITGKEALKFLYQMISAIKYLHSKRILHRNLNPSQILLTYDNTIKESGLSIAMKLDPGKDSDKTICNTKFANK